MIGLPTISSSCITVYAIIWEDATVTLGVTFVNRSYDRRSEMRSGSSFLTLKPLTHRSYDNKTIGQKTSFRFAATCFLVLKSSNHA